MGGCFPRGSIYSTFWGGGIRPPKYHTIKGIMGPSSLIAVYMDILGSKGFRDKGGHGGQASRN